jgi:hypothetical protein
MQGHYICFANVQMLSNLYRMAIFFALPLHVFCGVAETLSGVSDGRCFVSILLVGVLA